METLGLIVLSGIVGGVLLAILLTRFQHGFRAPSPFDKEPLSTDVINMARIRVAGIGGLGLVAMAAVVAYAVPRIGQTLALGLVLGGVMAASLILLRRRTGAMPSSGKEMGANTTLRL